MGASARGPKPCVNEDMRALVRARVFQSGDQFYYISYLVSTNILCLAGNIYQNADLREDHVHHSMVEEPKLCSNFQP
jgi:hypothetical protein